jgi:GNAT superfamily N-acetyltransferase
MTATPDFAGLMEATWPPAERLRCGPFTLRRGLGGGSRVSAATTQDPCDDADIAQAEAAMTAMGQRPLFMILPADAALDAALDGRGYSVMDPVVLYAARVADLGPPPDPMAAFPHWPPLQIARALWAEGGIGPERLAVMERVVLPRIAILGRTGDRPSGVAFVARSGPVAYLHALEVTPACRRKGAARALVRAAAAWAAETGDEWLALAVTEANGPARSLYASLGMQAVGQYHYRIKPA